MQQPESMHPLLVVVGKLRLQAQSNVLRRRWLFSLAFSFFLGSLPTTIETKHDALNIIYQKRSKKNHPGRLTQNVPHHKSRRDVILFVHFLKRRISYIVYVYCLFPLDIEAYYSQPKTTISLHPYDACTLQCLLPKSSKALLQVIRGRRFHSWQLVANHACVVQHGAQLEVVGVGRLLNQIVDHLLGRGTGGGTGDGTLQISRANVRVFELLLKLVHDLGQLKGQGCVGGARKR